METLKGFIIFSGTFALFAFVLTGIMGRSLRRIEKIMESQAKEDEKYVN